jgi:hypothetical protein
MTISIQNNDPRISYSVASGVTQTSFTIPFDFYSDSDVNVYVDDVLKVITTDYTISGGSGSTGTLTMSVTGASGTGSTVVILRNIPLDRTTDFPLSGPFNISSLNTELDRFVAITADQRDGQNQSITVPDAESYNMVLPKAADRAGKLVIFDEIGNVEVASEAAIGNIIVGANFITDAFTGDGSTVAFTLSVASNSKNNTQVHVDGVYQNKAGYSLNASVLTFSEAPPLNAAIEVVSGDSIAEGSTANSSAVEYNQDGTGAVNRTVKDKLQESVSVKDFGAVGDGATDDTAAINAAFSAVRTGLKRQTLYFPFGTYLISSKITVQNPNILMDRDAEIKAISGFSDNAMFEITNGNRAQTWQGGRINGNSVSGIKGIIAGDFDYAFTNMLIHDCDIGVETTSFSIYFINVQFRDNTTNGLHCLDTSAPWHNGLVDRCFFSGNGINIFAESSGSAITIQNSALQFVTGAYNIRMESTSSTTQQAALSIENNYFEENTSSTYSVSLFASGTGAFTAVSICGNSFVASGSTINEHAINIDSPTVRPVISSNRIANYARAIVSNTSGGGVVLGNDITSFNFALDLANIERWMVVNNRISGITLQNNGSVDITGGNSSVTITHGLSYTPDADGIAVVKTGDSTSTGAGFWIDNITSTTFDIVRAGTTGVSSFNWNAKICWDL